MAERDPSELDLAAAFRAYLEDAPTQVRPTELARQLATAYPHGTTTSGLWRLIAVPRPAWILLLLAALLAALVGGTLLVGSQLQRKLPAVLPPIGQVYACPPGSTPDKPGPVDQAGPPEADMGMAFDVAFDRRAGRLVAVTNAAKGVETWTFDVCTNTWAQMHPNREPSASGLDQEKLVYDIDSDATILVSYYGDTPGRVWAYDLQADVWTEKKAPPTIRSLFLAYDPVSGLVVAAEKYGSWGPSGWDRKPMWTYDVETDTWTPIHQALEPGTGDTVFAYDTSVDRMVVYTYTYNGYELVPETWLFDVRTGTWARSSAKTPGVVQGLGPPNIVYDEAAKRTVITGNVAAAGYDASANRWEMLVAYSKDEGWMPAPTMVYDPVNTRLVGRGPYYNAAGVHVGRAAVFAFDPGTRQWTVLLEPGEGQPANTLATSPAPTSARTATPPGGTEKTGPTSPVPPASLTSTPQSSPTP
jgi:hypothetical protein